MTTTPTSPATPDGADPSMEEIPASIRRILNDDETAPAEGAPNQTPAEDDVLVLDESMMVETPVDNPGALAPLPVVPVPVISALPAPVAREFARPEPAVSPGLAEPSGQRTDVVTSTIQPNPPGQSEPADLVAPEAAAAAASSVGNLMRTLAAGRATQVYSGGPTLEDMVRAELRPLLKDWLDTNLPPLVERLVRAEIERVVARAVP